MFFRISNSSHRSGNSLRRHGRFHPLSLLKFACGGLQGRYLFPGIVGLAAVVAWGLRDKRWAPLAVLVGAAAMQVTAWLTIVDFYWGGPDLLAEIQAMAAWAPWHPAVLALGAALLGVAVVATTAELVKEARGLKS